MTPGAVERPANAVAWWALAVLFLAYTLSFIDRTILALLVEPIKRDMGLSDTEISLLQGLAFSLVYTVGGIPIAMLADRRSRSVIVSAGVAVWSVMTALCGLAANFWQLFLARMGVGFGEASLGPCAYSLIADLFAEDKRGRAMAIYGAGVKVGAGLALVIGGTVIGFAAQSDVVDSWFGPLRSWQLVFLIVGLPGLLVALLALTIPEPRARDSSSKAPPPPAMPFLRENRTAILCHFIGLGFCAMTAVAIVSWVPTFYIRVHGYSAAEIGWTLGPILLVTGTLGAYCGGALSDWFSRQRVDGPMRAALIGIGLSTIFGPIAMLVASPVASLVLLTLGASFSAFCAPAGAAALQRMTPGPLRARVAALYLLVVTLISGIAGPTSVALATDYLFGDPLAIGWSLALVILVGDIVGAVFLLLGLRPFRETVARQG